MELPCVWVAVVFGGRKSLGDVRWAAVHTDDITKKLASCALKLICSCSLVCHHDSRKFSDFRSEDLCFKALSDLREVEILQSLKKGNFWAFVNLFKDHHFKQRGMCVGLYYEVHKMSLLAVCGAEPACCSLGTSYGEYGERSILLWEHMINGNKRNESNTNKDVTSVNTWSL